MYRLRVKIHVFFLAALSLAIVSCVGRTGKTDDSEQEAPVIHDISLEGALGDKRQFRLSEIAGSLEYVELKTPRGMPIMVINIAVSKEYIFVQSKAEVYQFTMSGDYIRRVGRQGRGPGEYSAARDIAVDENGRRVHITSGRELFTYSFDGEFLGNVETGQFEDYMMVSDSLIYASSIPFGYQTYKLLMLDGRRDTLGGIPNPNVYDIGGMTFGLNQRFREPFYKHGERIYFKGYADNDTIWLLEGTHYTPHAVINMGRFKSPEPTDGAELEKWWLEGFIPRKGDFYQIVKAQEDEGYIWLTCEPYFDPVMGSPRVIFDKAAGVGFSAVTATGEAGIEDDILRGPVFWPEIITDDRYISVVEAFRLLEATEKATGLAPEIKTFLDGVNEDTNTIVVMAKRK